MHWKVVGEQNIHFQCGGALIFDRKLALFLLFQSDQDHQVHLFLFSSFKHGWFPDPKIAGCLKCQSLNILEYPNRCRQQPGSVSVWSWSYSIELFPRGGFCWAQLGNAWISRSIFKVKYLLWISKFIHNEIYWLINKSWIVLLIWFVLEKRQHLNFFHNFMVKFWPNQK